MKIEVITMLPHSRRKPKKALKRLFKRSLGRKASKVAKRRKSVKKPTRTKLIKEADRVMSLYVRQSYADTNGNVKCYTCEYIAHWKKMQNGHWVVRQYKYTRWNLDNTRVQCFSCNFRYNGRPHLFRERLVTEIGEERVKTVERLAKFLFTEKDDFILERIEYFKEKLSQHGI